MTPETPSAETWQERVERFRPSQPTVEGAVWRATGAMLDDIQARQIRDGERLARIEAMLTAKTESANGSLGLSKHLAAYYTVSMEHGPLYYFAPVNRSAPPYLDQREVTAILDVAMDGTLAGVELVMGDLPPPPTPSAQDAAIDPAIRPDPIAENGPNLQFDPRDAVIEAARKLKFSVYPAHGAGYVTVVSAESVAAMSDALSALDREGM